MKDLLGQDLFEKDFVAFCNSGAYSATMSIGRVVSFTPKRIRIEEIRAWGRTGSLQVDRSETLLAQNKILKIEPPQIIKDIFEVDDYKGLTEAEREKIYTWVHENDCVPLLTP